MAGFGLRRLFMPSFVVLVLLSVVLTAGFGSAYTADTAEEAILSPSEQSAIVTEALEDPVDPPWYNEYFPEQYQSEPRQLTGWPRSLTKRLLSGTLAVTGWVSAWAWHNQWFPQWAAFGLSYGLALSGIGLTLYRSYSLVQRSHGVSA